MQYCQVFIKHKFIYVQINQNFSDIPQTSTSDFLTLCNISASMRCVKIYILRENLECKKRINIE